MMLVGASTGGWLNSAVAVLAVLEQHAFLEQHLGRHHQHCRECELG